MGDILEIVNVIGIVGAAAISTITLFTTRALQRSQQKASTMAKKRGDRIDLMREHSAGLISAAKQIIHEIDADEAKKSVIIHADKFISLLQYAYDHDVELIDYANDIVAISLKAPVSKDALRAKLDSFWRICDNYIAVEYERLKIESMGDINGSGKVKDENTTFEGLYKLMETQQNEFISKR